MISRVIDRLRLAGRTSLERCGYTIRPRTGLDLWHDIAALVAGHPRPVVFDVGANRGQTVWEIQRALPNAHITAFEPSPRAIPDLLDHYGEDPRVRVEQMAVGDTPGTLPLYLDSIHCANDSLMPARWHSSDTPTVTVPVVTVDGYCAERGIDRLDALKVDAQGFDLKVIHGARTMLERRAVGAVVSEVNVGLLYDGQPTMPELLRTMDAFGYALHGAYNQKHVNGSLLCLDLCWRAPQPNAQT